MLSDWLSEKMVDGCDYLKKRFLNLSELLTSKKALCIVGGVLLVVYVLASPVKIAVTGAMCCCYVLAQGWVDGKKCNCDCAHCDCQGKLIGD